MTLEQSTQLSAKYQKRKPGLFIHTQITPASTTSKQHNTHVLHQLSQFKRKETQVKSSDDLITNVFKMLPPVPPQRKSSFQRHPLLRSKQPPVFHAPPPPNYPPPRLPL